MNFVLSLADEYLFNNAYKSFYTIIKTTPLISNHFSKSTINNIQTYFEINHPFRQFTSLFIITLFGGYFFYFFFAYLDYIFLFDKSIKKNPKYLKNQIRKEIGLASWSIPIMVFLTTPWWLLEIRGYSKLYHQLNESPKNFLESNFQNVLPEFVLKYEDWIYIGVSIFSFVMFTDFLIYVIHRAEHHPSVYWWLHKPHHTWKVCTPFASHAFHPLDGYIQSLPYHLFVFLFPMHSTIYLISFMCVNFWTISIHDSVYLVKHPLFNGAAHHTIHHLEFNYNYGQYTTIWDRLFNSYKYPKEELTNEMFLDKLWKNNSKKVAKKEK